MKSWQVGEPLTPQDMEILQPLIERAAELGRTPKVSEIASSARIKARFRLWKHALLAAGLPALNDPEQVRLREAERGDDSRLPLG